MSNYRVKMKIPTPTFESFQHPVTTPPPTPSRRVIDNARREAEKQADERQQKIEQKLEENNRKFSEAIVSERKKHAAEVAEAKRHYEALLREERQQALERQRKMDESLEKLKKQQAKEADRKAARFEKILSDNRAAADKKLKAMDDTYNNKLKNLEERTDSEIKAFTNIVGREFENLYNTVQKSSSDLRKELQENSKRANRRIDAVMESFETMTVTRERKHQEFKIRVEAIEGIVDEMEIRGIGRFDELSPEYKEIKEKRDALVFALRNDSFELANVLYTQKQCETLRYKLDIKLIESENLLNSIMEIHKTNGQVLDFIEKSQTSENSRIYMTVDFGEKEEIPLELDKYARDDYQRLREEITGNEQILSSSEIKLEELKRIWKSEQELSRKLGCFASCNGKNTYVEGNLIKSAKIRQGKTVFAQEMNAKIVKKLLDDQRVNGCEKYGFVSGREDYPFYSVSRDRWDNEHVVMTEAVEDSKVAVYVQVCGEDLDPYDRYIQTKALAVNAREAIGNSGEIIGEDNPCSSNSTTEEFIDNIQRQVEERQVTEAAVRK